MSKTKKKAGCIRSSITVYNKLKREPDAYLIPSMTGLLVLTIYQLAEKSSFGR